MALKGIETSWARGLVGQALGHRHQTGRGGDDELGPGAEGAAGRDPLTHREALDALAECLDDPDGLGAGAGGHLRLEAVAAAHGPQVVVVDGGEQDPHQHLAGTGPGVGNLLDRQDLRRVTEAGLDECAHGSAFRGRTCCTSQSNR